MTIQDGGAVKADLQGWEALADAFVAEGTDHHFQLMGHGQMLWATSLDDRPGVRTVDARHEHCAVMAAVGYHYATGKVGVASVTCGPGFTQILTALAQAAQARVPVVVLAADAPVGMRWYNQTVDQIGLARGAGARVVAVRSGRLLLDGVQEAFHTARLEQMPVVLNIPYDLMRDPQPRDRAYIASTDLVPRLSPLAPHPDEVEALAGWLAGAARPILLAGRGALGAQDQIRALADRCGALLATTLPVRGAFDDDPFCIGLAGGFSDDLARGCFAEATHVLAIGASLTQYTTDGGTLYPQAQVAQIDTAPSGLRHGRQVAATFLRADAALGVAALASAIDPASGWRSDAMRARIDNPPPQEPVEIEDGLLDPRAVVAELDAAIPKDWDIVAGTGHSSYFTSHMKGRPPERHHLLREFGAIGSSLPLAIGVAVARGSGKVVLIDGDGGLMMHLQELESIRRQGIRLIVVALNDGGYGAEIHKLRNIGLSDRLATFGRPDFARIARGHDLLAENPGAGGVAEALARYLAADRAAIWDFAISTRVRSPRGRKLPV
ncbi:thiamine pyrophosphate-binding protein [Silicimonas algicola]|uniref:Thiamine pyrophosphate-dependent acetolactate synthase large subunit-like protein n=1 Tax=Silicimonas algicola TaxID=1826607 RepID=A0A316G1R8_9RHOB|nr:thiamine pyrophosphate-binding protein [Silicimonas algicola]AZQ68290.1 thiamine pyrophosphate-binding protein [Silicimonas algicola]PWK54573.1 thiamine pyrophosphate-dependent acetolactate synthase large subunit-like protein [Silicimonas algicola]